jgi:hypothetical protein
MWQRYLIDPLRGRTPLWQVIWIYGFGVSVLYALLEPLFAPSTRLGNGVYWALGIVIGIVQSVMLWQCAYNSSRPGYGRVLRVLVVVAALLFPLMLYFFWSHPELRELVG